MTSRSRWRPRVADPAAAFRTSRTPKEGAQKDSRLRIAPPDGCRTHSAAPFPPARGCLRRDRKSTRLNSSLMSISYAVFCLKKKKKKNNHLYIKKKKNKQKK